MRRSIDILDDYHRMLRFRTAAVIVRLRRRRRRDVKVFIRRTVEEMQRGRTHP